MPREIARDLLDHPATRPLVIALWGLAIVSIAALV